MNFKGDLVITDPCYFVTPDENWQLFCKALDNDDKNPLKQFGIEPAIVVVSDEIVGAVYDDKGQILGSFCSDSAVVCVCLLADVLKHNPDYNDFNDELVKDSVAIIRDFDGEIEVREASGEENEDCSFSFIGKGNINFRMV